MNTKKQHEAKYASLVKGRGTACGGGILKSIPKRIVSLILSLAMLLSLTAGLDLSAYAANENDEKILDDIVQQMIKVLPSTLYLDIPEIEFGNAKQAAILNAKEIWNKEGIDVEKAEKLDLEIFTIIYVHNIHTIRFEFVFNDGYKSAERKVKYNNTDNYNQSDAEYIKNLKLPENKKFYEVSSQVDLVSSVENYYNQFINDTSIEVGVYSYAGGALTPINFVMSDGVSLAVFKDEILYNILKLGEIISVPVISIAGEADNKDFEAHLMKKIYENFPEIDKASAIVSGFKAVEVYDKQEKKYIYKDYDYPKGYTFTGECAKFHNYNGPCYIVVNFIKHQFSDLKGFEVYNDYVMYTSVYNNFITGTNPPANNVFSPTAPINRAMFVTILYRMAGSPYDNGNNPYKSTPFTDITNTSAYYYNAACWALENGITTETVFKPFDNVTREQAASMLFRYATANDWVDEAYKTADITKYPDYSSVHIWAQEPMQWANYNKMITGTQQGYLNPQGATQRVHATKILYGFGTSCGIGNFE